MPTARGFNPVNAAVAGLISLSVGAMVLTLLVGTGVQSNQAVLDSIPNTSEGYGVVVNSTKPMATTANQSNTMFLIGISVLILSMVIAVVVGLGLI